MSTVEAAVNREQLRAIEEQGVVFVSAGAGTGKTTVIVERFCRAVCERGVDVDSILVITYTERAAGELRGRIRKRLLELDRHDLVRELDAAWISTIHGFCHRLLKAHPFAAGIDPRFRVVDDSQGRVLRGEAFRAALEEFCGDDEARLRLLASYGGRRLRRMLTGVHETLRSSGLELRIEAPVQPRLDERLEELRLAVRDAGDETALRFLDSTNGPEELLDLSDLRSPELEEPRQAVEQAALEALAARDREQLQELLLAYDRAYREAKDRESALDFEDLQLLARELLRANPEIRERESWRFRSIMVDEFQDTNRLQCELVDLLADDDSEVFFVGDEFQSIYRFRHADVEVFRERREQVGGVLALTQNYRSRPEVLEVINHLFAADFGETFQPLEAAGRFPDPAFGPAVELLVTDKESYAETGVHWRKAEAKHIAGRVRDLVDSGEATPGEIVLLFAAGTDARIYEEELRALGLPTFRATGRDYYHQQQVVDLLNYLRLLHNRYDDEALLGVLASPFVGVSNDALVLLRRAAPKRPTFRGPREGDSGGRLRAGRTPLPGVQAALRPARHAVTVAVSRTALRADRRRARLRPRRSRPVGRAAAVREPAQARADGALLRGAARARRAGLRAFRRRAGRGRRLGARGRRRGRGHGRDPAADHPLGQGARVQGRRRRRRGPRPRAARRGRDPLPAGRPARLPRRRSRDRQAAADGRVRERQGGRAGRRGGRAPAPLLRRDDARDRPADRLRRDRRAWGGRGHADRLGARPARGRASSRMPPPGRWRSSAAARACSCGSTASRRSPRSRRSRWPSSSSSCSRSPRTALLRRRRPSSRRSPRCRRRRFTACAGSRTARSRCSSAARTATSPSGSSACARPTRPGPCRASRGLAATEIGDAVHALLEHVDLRAPAVPEDLAELVRARYPAVTDEELERIRGFVASYCESELAARIGALEGATAELPFAFEHDGVLLHGRIDVLHRDGPRALVLDYKTNSLAEGTPEEIVEHDYRLQRLVYALACFRAGAEEVEVVYHFLERPDAVVTATYRVDDVPGARGRAVRGDRADPGERVPPDAGRVRLPRLPGARPRLRGPEAPRLMARSYVREARRRVGPKRERIRPIIERLLAEHPDATIALTFRNDLELLVSVMLSAQTTDVNVNRVTERLFEKYRTPQDYLAVSPEELENDIRATGFFRQKAKALRGTMAMLLEEFDGQVPRRWTSCCGCRAWRARRRTSSSPSAARPRGSWSTRTCAGSRSGSA